MRDPEPVNVSAEIRRGSTPQSGSGRATRLTCPRVMVAPTGHSAWWRACSHSRWWEKPAPRRRPVSLQVEPIQRAPFGVVGARVRREVAESRTLLDSRPVRKEGSCMDPTRLPYSPHPLALGSQTACGKAQ